jgi:hypothetical protein
MTEPAAGPTLGPRTRPLPVDPVTTAAFRLGGRLRRARAFHPVGVAFRARARIDGDVPPGFPSGEHDAVVRFSRGAGLPEQLPDFLGIGVRLVDALGPGRHQDLLGTSTGSGPITRRLLRPARDFASGRLDTILPYATVDGPVLFSARVLTPGSWTLREIERRGAAAELLLELGVADRTGGWRRLGEVAVLGRLPVDDERRLDLDPFHTSPDVVPTGLLNRLRRPAYTGSREGRAAS